MIKRIMIPGLREPVSHFCHVTTAGPNIWVSGLTGMKADGTISESTVDQFDVAMDVMAQCLAAAGAGPQHVVKVVVFMTDIKERPLINPRRVAFFGEHRPASTLVEVSGLVDPRMKVEIEAHAWRE